MGILLTVLKSRRSWLILALLYVLLFAGTLAEESDWGDEEDKKAVLAKLNEFLEDQKAEDGTPLKLELENLTWNGEGDTKAAYYFNISGNEQALAKLKSLEITDGAFEDNNLNEEEWDAMMFWDNFSDFDSWKAGHFAIVIVPCVLIIIAIIAYCCLKKKPPAQQVGATQVVTRRRRLDAMSPIASLAHKTECDVLQTSFLPRPGRKLTENHLPMLFAHQDPWGLPGLNDHNIWWIIPVSCLTQLMWIYVAYKIYKRCVQSKRRSENAPLHELREITVRR